MKYFNDGKLVVKSWCNNPEEGAVKQAINLANLPFAFKHICLMPDTHEGYGMPIGGVLATKGVIVPNAVGVDIGCFSGDTKVPLLNGTEETLKELTKRKKPFYVYSVNNKKEITGCLAISKRTRKNVELVEVILDNGQKIKCTLDHKFMLRDGSYCEAKDLRSEDRLMPLYRKYDKDNYESVYNPKTRTYQRTHWALARTGVLGKIPIFENQKTIIHHSNFNQKNNDPENLKFMGNKDHSKYHRSIVERNTHWQSPKFEKNRITSIRNKIKNDEEFLRKKQEIGKKNILKYMSENKDEFMRKIKNNGKRGREFLIKYNKSEKGRKKSSEIGKKYGFGASWNKNRDNHKVVSIKKLNKKEDVYCLTVDKYHNFALSAGVFVHNCGMCAVKTSLTNIDMETLKKIMGEIRKVVPVGFNHHKEEQDKELMPELTFHLTSEVVGGEYESALYQIGTLGGGNHFIEIQKGNDGYIWIMLHSGSRNLGYKVAKYFNEVAKELNKKWYSEVSRTVDVGLAFLPVDSKEGQNYLREMNYCVDFAFANRKLMMNRIKSIFEKYNENIEFDEMINIAHNYARLENHFGVNVWVHRKGATSARKGEIGIIPGSQGTTSYIVEGLGNPESFTSCSHGAGRRIGRKKAREELNLKEEQNKLQGIIHSVKSKEDLDEAPSAYKDIDIVMEEQKDLVKKIIELKPIGVIKG